MFFVLCIALMVMDHYSHFLINFRALLLTTIDPIERAATIPLSTYQYFQQDFKTVEELKKRNQQLATENLLLKARQQQLNKLQHEVSRLNLLLGTASQMSTSDVQIANIKYYNLSPYSQFFTLDKGSLDGVKLHQAVIDAKGLIGQITSVTPTTSRVQLITDSDIQIPVRIQRTGQRGILTGMGQTQLSLQFIPNTSSIKIGDIIETSGLGNVYPNGYPVATVSSINTLKDQPYYEIMADPVADINLADKVLILSPVKNPSIDVHIDTKLNGTADE